MTTEELLKLEDWYLTLKEVQQSYPGNINLDTIIRSILSRINEFKNIENEKNGKST